MLTTTLALWRRDDLHIPLRGSIWDVMGPVCIVGVLLRMLQRPGLLLRWRPIPLWMPALRWILNLRLGFMLRLGLILRSILILRPGHMPRILMLRLGIRPQMIEILRLGLMPRMTPLLADRLVINRR